MLHVRPADESDAEPLSALAARLFEQTFGPRNTASDMQAYLASAFSVEGMRADLADPKRKTWIAEDRPTPESNVEVGYAVVRMAPAPPAVVGSSPVEIARLYADEQWHGRGVGAALMSTCLKQSREWKGDVVWLGVWEANPRAIAFYQKHGFRIVAAQTFQLGADLQRDHVMVRPLD